MAAAFGVLAFASLPGAFAGSERDPRANYGHAKADIASIGQRRDGHVLVHTLRTYGRWDNEDLSNEGIGIAMRFFTDDDDVADRSLAIADDAGRLVATLYGRHHRSWPIPASRPDDRTVSVRIPRRLIEGHRRPITYEWQARVGQSYAVPIPCESPSPQGSPSPSSSPSSTPSAPVNSPTPTAAPTYCGHGDFFSSDVAPDRGHRVDLMRPSSGRAPPRSRLVAHGREVPGRVWRFRWIHRTAGRDSTESYRAKPSWRPCSVVGERVPVRIRWRRADRPSLVSIYAYRRIDADGVAMGPRRHLRVRLRPVRRSGHRVGWDALFELPSTHRYYLYVEGRWSKGQSVRGWGSASWSVCVRPRR